MMTLERLIPYTRATVLFPLPAGFVIYFLQFNVISLGILSLCLLALQIFTAFVSLAVETDCLGNGNNLDKM